MTQLVGAGCVIEPSLTSPSVLQNLTLCRHQCLPSYWLFLENIPSTGPPIGYTQRIRDVWLFSQWNQRTSEKIHLQVRHYCNVRTAVPIYRIVYNKTFACKRVSHETVATATKAELIGS